MKIFNENYNDKKDIVINSVNCVLRVGIHVISIGQNNDIHSNFF